MIQTNIGLYIIYNWYKYVFFERRVSGIDFLLMRDPQEIRDSFFC